MLLIRFPACEPVGARRISLTHGFFAIVDAELFDWLNQRRWRAQKSAASVYAISRVRARGKTWTIRMHRLIMDTPAHMKVHHINHDSLDNRKANLMNVTEREHRHYDGWHIFEASKNT